MYVRVHVRVRVCVCVCVRVCVCVCAWEGGGGVQLIGHFQEQHCRVQYCMPVMFVSS